MELTVRKNLRLRHHAPHALQEVAEIASRLEPEQVELEQGAQESLLLREFGEDVLWRKRNVQEKRQGRAQAAVAQCLGDVHQMIIVHPDKVVRLTMSRD